MERGSLVDEKILLLILLIDEKKRTTGSKVDGVTIGVPLENLKEQLKDRSSWRKSMIAKSQEQFDDT